MSTEKRGGTPTNSGAAGPYKDGHEGKGNSMVPKGGSVDFLGSSRAPSDKMAGGLCTGKKIKSGGRRPVGGKRVMP